MYSRTAEGETPPKPHRVEIDGLPLTKNGSLKVELVPMSGGDNPWRTKEDYREEQRRDTVRFYVTMASFDNFDRQCPFDRRNRDRDHQGFIVTCFGVEHRASRRMLTFTTTWECVDGGATGAKR